tara:strand:- start:2212 stop:3438 length:1227 start_codon:yes stop_codon:yes gene_type:complete
MSELVQSNVSKRRLRVLSSSGFAHFIHDGLTDTVYVLLPLWAAGFGLSHAQVGLLKSCLSTGLALFQVPSGYLAERFSERSVMVFGTALAGFGFLGLAISESFFGMAICLFAAGVGCSVQHPIASAQVSTAYANGRRRAALGTYNFIGDLGKVCIPAGVAAIAAVYGWQVGSASLGTLGVIAAVILYVFLSRIGIQNKYKGESKREIKTPPGETHSGWGIVDGYGFSALVVISMIDSACRFGVLTFIPFVLISKGAATESVGFALALIFGGGALGKLICGLVAERMGILKTVVFTELSTVLLIFGVLIVPLEGALVMLPVLGVALNGTSSVLYGTVGDFIESERQAKGFGLFYTFGIGAGVAAPFGFGLISDLWGLQTAVSIMAMMVLLTLPFCLVLRQSLANIHCRA